MASAAVHPDLWFNRLDSRRDLRHFLVTPAVPLTAAKS
jgi:hypothetical protein